MFSNKFSSKRKQDIAREFEDAAYEFKHYLRDIKKEFDQHDARNTSIEDREKYLEQRKQEIAAQFDAHFKKIWELVKALNEEDYNKFKDFYFQKISPMLGKPIEINWHIYKKPYGYPGDFKTMNYIYDFASGDYLGDSSFEMLINNYTCNISIARSNVIRKDFLKDNIRKCLNKYSDPEILSIGAGSSREIIELLDEETGISANCTLLDFEKDALKYVQDNIREKVKDHDLKINYLLKNIVHVIKFRNLDLNYYNLVYIAGVFDYFPDRICQRITKKTYDLLLPGGELMIFNAAEDNNFQRAYYEFLGDWNMQYRVKEEMLRWVENLENVSETKFISPDKDFKYLILSITKEKSHSES